MLLAAMVGAVMLHSPQGGPTFNASFVSSLEPFREKWLPRGIREVACGLAEFPRSFYIRRQQLIVNAAYHGTVTPFLSPSYLNTQMPQPGGVLHFFRR
jgi:hypothetical protein